MENPRKWNSICHDWSPPIGPGAPRPASPRAGEEVRNNPSMVSPLLPPRNLFRKLLYYLTKPKTLGRNSERSGQ